MATLAGNGYVLLGLAERYSTCVVDVGSERSSSGTECGSGTIFFSGRRCLFLSWRSGWCGSKSGYGGMKVERTVGDFFLKVNQDEFGCCARCAVCCT